MQKKDKSLYWSNILWEVVILSGYSWGLNKHVYFIWFHLAISCYQCAYSPPKTYYDQKVKVESYKYGKAYGQKNEDGYGKDDGYHGEKYGGYVKKSYIPVPYNVNVSVWPVCIWLITKQIYIIFNDCYWFQLFSFIYTYFIWW